jgi:shikimate kinase
VKTITLQRRGRIYLTGFMGSGKSTIGPILANTIGYDFVDLDQSIERKEGKSISRIFTEEGEPYFRGLERSLLGAIAARPRVVVSLGGGTLVDPESFRLIRESGILVYIKLHPDLLFKRLQRKNDRPLLLGDQGRRLSGEDLRRRIRQLAASREHLYAQADLTIEADERRVGITVDRVVHALVPFVEM